MGRPTLKWGSYRDGWPVIGKIIDKVCRTTTNNVIRFEFIRIYPPLLGTLWVEILVKSRSNQYHRYKSGSISCRSECGHKIWHRSSYEVVVVDIVVRVLEENLILRRKTVIEKLFTISQHTHTHICLGKTTYWLLQGIVNCVCRKFYSKSISSNMWIRTEEHLTCNIKIIIINSPIIVMIMAMKIYWIYCDIANGLLVSVSTSHSH